MAERDGFLRKATTVEFINKQEMSKRHYCENMVLLEPSSVDTIRAIQSCIGQTLDNVGPTASLQQLLVQRLVSKDQERFSLYLVIVPMKRAKSTLIELIDAVVVQRDAKAESSHSDRKEEAGIVTAEKLALPLEFKSVIQKEFDQIWKLGHGFDIEKDPVRFLHVLSSKNDYAQIEVEYPHLVRFSFSEKTNGFETKVERFYKHEQV